MASHLDPRCIISLAKEKTYSISFQAVSGAHVEALECLVLWHEPLSRFRTQELVTAYSRALGKVQLGTFE